MLGVTFVAIDWAVTFGFKGDFTILTAISTFGLIHPSIGPDFRFFLGAAIWASLRLILKTFLLIEILFRSGPDEVFTTIFTL